MTPLVNRRRTPKPWRILRVTSGHIVTCTRCDYRADRLTYADAETRGWQHWQLTHAKGEQ